MAYISPKFVMMLAPLLYFDYMSGFVLNLPSVCMLLVSIS